MPPPIPSSSTFPETSSDLISSGVVPDGPLECQAEFPLWALQPKKETGARAFGTRFPEYDGRGTIIAILDSGVDPGAGGLQITSDGKRKVIDRIDASGAGDVDMSKVVKPVDGVLEGATGRSLHLPEDCQGYEEYRVGWKKAYSLYPKSLKDRIVKDRQEKLWDPPHKLRVAQAARKLQEYEAQTKSSSSPPTGMAKLERENIETEHEVLVALDKKFKDSAGNGNGGSSSFNSGCPGGSGGDVGPIYDVVLFHDKQSWVCLIDTSECGKLDSGVRLRPFRETGDLAPLTKEDKLNVSVNVYDDGDVLQLVSMCSPHGTHVASIAAAHFPDEPQKSGLAPGAQIVSISIGDARLHAMETGTALCRAMMHILRAEHYKVDVINMSYGEHSHWSNTGRVGELMGEVINKMGVTWIVSAGNDGPALSTVGTPPDIATNTAIGVGAYVSPEMMVALYSSREKLPGTPYTWTSRGPTIDGYRGVTICAPGGAITSVPNFTLKCTQLMNGTSMASPHVCGAVSLLISGMKSLGLGYSPFSIKRALENSALHLKDRCHYAQGHGLLQLEGAFNHLTTFHNAPERDVRFAVTCNGNQKGIHLRQLEAVSKKQEIPVKVEPVFLDSTSVPADLKIDFNVRLALTCNQQWVSHPAHVDLMHTTRHFVVSIDPTGLQPGAHSAYIKAYDVNEPQKGHLFEVPITVVKSEPLTIERRPCATYPKVVFGPGEIKRYFLMVPQNATWAVIRVNSHEKFSSGKFVIHTVQLAPKLMVHSWEHDKMFSLPDNGEFTYSIPVRERLVLEVCLAKWWANIGSVEVSISVNFHGLQLDQREVSLHGGDAITRLEVSSRISNEEVLPEIKLKSLVQNFRPFETKILALSSTRDVVPPNRQIYELQLSYSFSLSKSTEVTPSLPLLSNVLYESEYESQLWMLYNSHKQLVVCGDAYPHKWSAKVDKEEYTLKVHVRSEHRPALERLTDMPLLLTSKLSSSVSVDVYQTFDQASTGGKKISSSSGFTLSKGSVVPIYVAAVNTEKFMKAYTPGQYLQGTMTLAKDELGKKVDVYKVRYVLNEAPKKEKNGGSGASVGKKKQSPETSLLETMAEAKLSWLAKLDYQSEESKALLEELKNDKTVNALQLAMSRLSSLELDKKLFPSSTEEKTEDDAPVAALDPDIASEVVALCTEITTTLVDIDAVLAHSALKHDSREDAQDIKKDMEKKKNAYIEATCKLGLTHLSQGDVEAASECLLRLWRVVDLSDAKVVSFCCAHAEALGHWGRAIKLAISQLESKPGAIEVENKIVRLLKKFDCQHAEDLARKSIQLRYPEGYELF